jgi:hypothetical protein
MIFSSIASRREVDVRVDSGLGAIGTNWVVLGVLLEEEDDREDMMSERDVCFDRLIDLFLFCLFVCGDVCSRDDVCV